ncbi:MAG: amidohydrolase family protein [Cyclobacteriaceae bacterium]|nr:amidohydrolase family protein [Cyclobacteriaceae bacterium SS2]
MKIINPILILLFVACSQNKLQEVPLLIENVSVINVRDGSITENQYVAIDSGIIVSITDKAGVTHSSKNVIDGTGKFLMPGLAEMHAHIPTETTWGGKVKNTLILYVSQGVTTIRGMQGNALHLELRSKAEKQEIISPRIYTSSPPLNGSTVKTIEEADEKVRKYAADGYDLLKILPGIKLEVFDQIVKTAKEVGIPYAGHVPADVGVRHAIESGYASIDHMDGYLTGLVPASVTSTKESGFFGYNYTNDADTSLIDELVTMTRENNVWVVPTQTLFTRWFSPGDPQEYASQPEMKYMPEDIVENWAASKKRMIEADNFNETQWRKYIDIREKFLLALHRNGKGLILGSDAPQVFNVPGFSIHHELGDMLDVGLTPLEAIQTGTINAAKYFDREGQFGEVIENASADLILVNTNPLEDLSTIKSHAGVVVRGRWLSPEEIAKELEEIAR